MGLRAACGGGLGSTYLVGYLCSLSFPFVRRGVARNNVTYLRLALLTHVGAIIVAFFVASVKHTGACTCVYLCAHVLHPSCPFIPWCLSVAVAVVLFLG